MDAIAKLELFNTLFYVSLGIAIFGFLLAAFFLFLFRIPQLFALSTGQAKKKTLEQMRKQGKSSGSIRQGKSPGKENRSYAAAVVEAGGRTEKIGVAAPAGKSLDTQQTTALGTDQTTVLSAEKTSESRADKPETTVLKENPRPGGSPNRVRTAPLSAKRPRPDGPFHITEETVLIHTDETI